MLNANEILFVSGRRFDLVNPRALDFSLADYAHRASRMPALLCTHVFYSHAQRVVLLAEMVAGTEGPQGGLWGLLAGAAGVLTGQAAAETDRRADIPVSRLMEAIERACDLAPPGPPLAVRIEDARGRLLLTELRCLGSQGVQWFADEMREAGIVPAPRAIRAQPADKAMDAWLNAWRGYAAQYGRGAAV